MQMDAFKKRLDRLHFCASYKCPATWKVEEAQDGMDESASEKALVIEEGARCRGYIEAIEHVRIVLKQAEKDELYPENNILWQEKEARKARRSE